MTEVVVKFFGDAIEEIQFSNPSKLVKDAADRAQEMARIGASCARKVFAEKDSGIQPVFAKPMVERYHTRYGKAFLLFFGFKKSNFLPQFQTIHKHLHVLHNRLNKSITVNIRPTTGTESNGCDGSNNAYRLAEVF